MDIQIRQAQLSDIPLLVKARIDFLIALGHAVTEENAAIISKQVEQFLTQHLNRDIFAWIALDGETAAAAGFLTLFQGMAHVSMPSGTYGRITNMLTWPAYRSRGLARRIMNELINKAKENNVDFVNLDASDMGRPLYESLGFVDFIPKDPPMILTLNKN